jgi:hypothetical protein
VQIVYSSHRGSREIEHLGSAHSGAQVELLKAAARQRLAAGQGELGLGLAVGAPGGPLPITSTRMGHLLDALEHGYRVLGLGHATGGDEVFAQLVLARIIEPISKLDSARVLEEAGLEPASYPTINRRLRAYAQGSWREKLAAACAGHAGLGPASLVLYDVSTLLCRRRHKRVYITNLAACPDGTPITSGFVIAARSKPTSASCSPRSPSAAGSKHALAGASRSLSAPPAVTAPSRSRPGITPSPPPTPFLTTCARP